MEPIVSSAIDPTQASMKCRLPCSSQSDLRTVSKLEALLKDFEGVYEDMGDCKAEGKINGFGEKFLDLTHLQFSDTFWVHKMQNCFHE